MVKKNKCKKKVNCKKKLQETNLSSKKKTLLGNTKKILVKAKNSSP